MTDPTPSSFSGRTTSRWVWIVPSVLLHVVVLVLWLSMPEAPPREPGERKPNINREQAEQLQKHVEDANLAMLRSKVNELGTIKKAMLQIRQQRMDQLREFEREMTAAAPDDAADLFSELGSHQEAIIRNYREILGIVEKLNAQTPPMEAMIEEDPIAAIGILRRTAPLRKELALHAEEVDELFTLTGATLHSVETRMEWIGEPGVSAELDTLKSSLEAASEAKNKAMRAVGAAYGHGWAFNNMLDHAEERIESIRSLQRDTEAREAAFAKESRLSNKPDGSLVSQARRIRGGLNRVFGPPPDTGLVTEAIGQQRGVIEASKALVGKFAAMETSNLETGQR